MRNSEPAHRQHVGLLGALLSSLALFGNLGDAEAAPHLSELDRGIWVDRAQVALLPAAGAAWEEVLEDAAEDTSTPNLSDQNDKTNVLVLAKALAYVRTGDADYRDQVITACMAAMGTEAGGQSLALGRELIAYVIAADLVGLPESEDARYRAWLRSVRDRTMADGRTLRTTHAQRPNNWGTHAGASRIAVAAYLRDTRDLDEAARVFKGWLGDRSSYAGFKYRDLSWQADPDNPIGINPEGARKEGHSIDGVLPDDQRRAGSFQWPPPTTNYVYEALQGALAQAILLHRAGYEPFEWEDRALLRAFRWLHEQVDFPAEGDDTWQPFVVNLAYGTSYPAPVPSRPGKNVGYTDWTHAPGSGALNRAPIAAPENLRVLD